MSSNVAADAGKSGPAASAQAEPSFWRAVQDFLDQYFPLTFSGVVLLGVSFYLLGHSFATRNGFALWFSLLGFTALLLLGFWGRIQAFRLRHLQVNRDVARPPVARLKDVTQKYTVGGGRAPFFFRLHYMLRGKLYGGRGVELPINVEGVGTEEARSSSGMDSTKIEVPLWLPVCGRMHLGGRMVLRDVFGLTRHRIGPEEFRDVMVLPPPIPDKTPVQFHTMFSEEASRRREISEEEKYYMREYIPGDRLKDINWKASQRVSELITRISPHALEESKLLHVEFRNFQERDQDSPRALLHLNFLKSWVLSFMLGIKREHPEFLFQIMTGAGVDRLETEDEIQNYARVLAPLPFMSARQAEEAEQDPSQEKFIFTTMYDTALVGRLAAFPGVRYNIFRTVPGRGKKGRRVRFFRPEIGAPWPGAWVMRADGAPSRVEPPNASGVYVEQALKVKVF